jgi:cytochrome c5
LLFSRKQIEKILASRRRRSEAINAWLGRKKTAKRIASSGVSLLNFADASFHAVGSPMCPPKKIRRSIRAFLEANRERLEMKLQPVARIKIFIVLISVLFVLTVWMANSKSHLTVVHARGGAEIYAASCARCHGADGRGQTPKGRQTGAKDFTDPKWQALEDRGIRAITNGKGKMPAFKGTLSPEEIKAVWEHVRGFKR